MRGGERERGDGRGRVASRSELVWVQRNECACGAAAASGRETRAGRRVGSAGGQDAEVAGDAGGGVWRVVDGMPRGGGRFAAIV
jgi:hypothetical protein